MPPLTHHMLSAQLVSGGRGPGGERARLDGAEVLLLLVALVLAHDEDAAFARHDAASGADFLDGGAVLHHLPTPPCTPPMQKRARFNNDHSTTVMLRLQYSTLSRYLARSRGTPLPPSSLPSALRIMVMGVMGSSRASSCTLTLMTPQS